MPLYDYVCPSCGHNAGERLVKRSEADSQKCPECGATLERQPSKAAFFFNYLEE